MRLKRIPARAQYLPKSRGEAQLGAVNATLSTCSFCGHLQLHGAQVPYFREVIRASAVSSDWIASKNRQFEKFINDYGLANSVVVEIGSGRGEFLTELLHFSPKSIGLEASIVNVHYARARGLPVVFGYPEDGWWPDTGPPADAFVCLNFLEHSPDPAEFLRQIHLRTTAQSIGIIEVPNGDLILERAISSEVMVDHLSYFTRQSLSLLCQLSGFAPREFTEQMGGLVLSVEVEKVCSTSLDHMTEASDALKSDLGNYIARFPQGSVAVWGASHQSLAVLAQLPDSLAPKYIVDSASFKQGKFAPVSGIPIVSPDTLRSDSTLAAVVVMAGGYSQEVVELLRSYVSDRVERAFLKDEILHCL